jgi:Family of unknown function (DUF6221)
VRTAGNAKEGATVSENLAARIAALAMLIAVKLDEDERVAKVATDGPWIMDGMSVRGRDRIYHGGSAGAILVIRHTWPQEAAHIVRNAPDRVLRRVRATRDLVAAILAERHDYNDGDEFYSCSQAAEPGTDGEPGSGCANDERAGKPCDCGRDMRVARLLGIIASEWEDA